MERTAGRAPCVPRTGSELPRRDGNLTEHWATFDCYGTLIDWERGIVDACAGLWPDADRAAILRRYHEVEPEVQRGSGASYREVLADALRRVAAAEALTLDPDDADALAASLPEWPPFAEVPDALARLKDDGWRIGVLSNTDPDLLDASIKRIGVEVDARVTVAEAGSYKPAHGHWTTFFETTGAGRSEHAHVAASLFHDIAPANELELRAVWINRKDETTDLSTIAELGDLRALPETLESLR